MYKIVQMLKHVLNIPKLKIKKQNARPVAIYATG
jgi:hypothetical protein